MRSTQLGSDLKEFDWAEYSDAIDPLDVFVRLVAPCAVLMDRLSSAVLADADAGAGKGTGANAAAELVEFVLLN